MLLYYLKYFFVFSTIIFCFFLSCAEENPLQSSGKVAPELFDLIAPERVYNVSPKLHTISVRVDEPQGISDIASVSFTITKSGETAAAVQGQLIDDGARGDIIPNDGVFTAQIAGTFAGGDTGGYDLEVTAQDKSGNDSNVLQAQITVVAGTENLPPEIQTVVAPNSVTIDSLFDFLISVQITDPEGLTDISAVVFQFFPPANPTPTIEDTLSDTGQLGDVTAGDGIYTATLSSGLFKEASDYFVRFQAMDKFGNKSLPKVVTITGGFKLNNPPVISNLVAPDTVQIDPTQTVQVLITINATDPEGLSDIDFVRFRSFLPNGNEALTSPFAMSDNGDDASGDEIAGDGTYSITINLPPTAVRGDFTFIFEAKDKSDAFSNQITHVMTVID